MEDDDNAAPPPRRRRKRRAASLLAGVMVAALVGLWIERRPIAGRFVDRELTRRGVPARYTIADLGPGRQRLTDVVIGDPADPDLVADWVETRIGYTLAGPVLTGIATGHVRLRGRVVDGRVVLGAIDRLLPPPSGKPFALPALDVDVADARLRLETPAGLVGLAIAGRGVLNDGFAGRVAAVAPALRAGGCTLADTRAAMRVRIAAARPSLTGPVRAAAVRCGGIAVADPHIDLSATLAAALDRWQGNARLATGAVRVTQGRGQGHAAAVAGSLDFGGTATATTGSLDLAATRAVTLQASAARLTLAGRYRLAARPAFAGRVGVAGAGITPATLAGATAWRGAGAGSPVAPIVAALAGGVARAGRDFAADADLRVEDDAVAVTRLALVARSGARLAFTDGPVTIGTAGIRLVGDLALAGGGLPTARIALAQASVGAPIRGTATIAPYQADGARLALSPVTFTATPGGTTRIATRTTLSGPFADGRVEALTTPLSVVWNGRGRLTLNPGCAPLGWRRLAVGGLALDAATLRLCPTGAALVQVDGGAITGGARLAPAHLTGTLGGTPLALDLGTASARLGARGFAIADVAARLGQPGRESHLAIATLTGTLGTTVTGTFAGGGGQIANVPLILSAAQGTWQVAGGALDLDGAMTVADQAAAPRFRPLAARAVTLRLAAGRIAAAGTLREPTTGNRVADVTIAHELASGAGTADIAVPDLVFAQGYQPDLLTPLTFGVVADVRGTVTGQGHIAWDRDGVTSHGEFATAAMDLAAAFGPVTGIATTIRFTDLLGMKTAPGQIATVRTVNPGIPVADGTVRYAIAGPTLVQVEGARWPFAGGTLTLEPTLLDFSENRQRRMTFRVDGAAADQFLQQFDFDNLDATGIFDGVLPMVFDEQGGRIEQGRLVVRSGGGSLAYVGALGQEQLGLWGNLAFQALKSLRYRSLALTLSGPLTGEMVTDVRFAGISQGEGAKGNFLVRRLQRLPFVFNIRIKAPFRGLLDSAQSFYDPKRLIQRNLPALLEEQRRAAGAPPATTPPVQPPASETVR